MCSGKSVLALEQNMAPKGIADKKSFVAAASFTKLRIDTTQPMNTFIRTSKFDVWQEDKELA